MSLLSSKEILIKAKKENYAVAAFNVYNLETFQAVVETANRLKSPVITAVSPPTVKYVGAEYLLGLCKIATKKYDIPIVMHLDHATNIDEIKELIKMGFKSVMIDASKYPFEKNIEIVQEIVKYAKPYNVSVEAELGRLTGTEDSVDINKFESLLTNPDSVIEYTQKTQVDSLAIAIGTLHGSYKKKPNLDFSRLEKISKKTNLPLVLHGASGVIEKDVRKTIDLGIAKVNIATELKTPFTKGIREYLIKHPTVNDPRIYIQEGKKEMEAVVENKINLVKSNNRI